METATRYRHREQIIEPPDEGAPDSSRAATRHADAMMTAYVGYLAGWFDIGQLAAGRRLQRAGVHTPLLNE